jgi:hypothetical protein
MAKVKVVCYGDRKINIVEWGKKIDWYNQARDPSVVVDREVS